CRDSNRESGRERPANSHLWPVGWHKKRIDSTELECRRGEIFCIFVGMCIVGDRAQRGTIRTEQLNSRRATARTAHRGAKRNQDEPAEHCGRAAANGGASERGKTKNPGTNYGHVE